MLKSFQLKLLHIYLPFLLSAIGLLILYGLFRWVLDIKLGLLSVKGDLLNLWIPFALPWVAVLFWLRRRIGLLNLRFKDGDVYFLYKFLMAVAMTIPLIVSQSYLETASYPLITLENASQVSQYPSEKYFQIKSFEVDAPRSLSHVSARTFGRNQDDLRVYIYLACPLAQSRGVWYGIKFQESINKRLSDDKKDKVYQDFVEKTKQDFEAYDFQNLSYFEKLGYSDDQDGFLEAVQKGSTSPQRAKNVILIPQKEEFSQRVGSSFYWIFASWGMGAFLIFGMVWIPPLDSEEVQRFENKQARQNDDMWETLQYLNPGGKYRATACLFHFTCLVFLGMVFSGVNVSSPTSQELLDFGGIRRGEVYAGEYWRLLTAIFIHSGIMHLAMNLFALVLAGILLERVIGPFTLLGSFLLSGLLGSLASITWHENMLSVGASGAIMGLYGLVFLFVLFKIYPPEVRSWAGVFLGIFLGGTFLMGLLGGFDQAAHLGGFLIGCLLGGLFMGLDGDKLVQKANEDHF